MKPAIILLFIAALLSTYSCGDDSDGDLVICAFVADSCDECTEDATYCVSNAHTGSTQCLRSCENDADCTICQSGLNSCVIYGSGPNKVCAEN